MGPRGMDEVQIQILKTLNAILGLEALSARDELRQRQDLKKLILKTMEENETVIAEAEQKGIQSHLG